MGQIGRGSGFFDVPGEINPRSFSSRLRKVSAYDTSREAADMETPMPTLAAADPSFSNITRQANKLMEQMQ